jgi:hypothetical protein
VDDRENPAVVRYGHSVAVSGTPINSDD